MSFCTLYIVRHGQSEYNRDNIVSGHVDPILTQEGIAQAKKTKRELERVRFDTVYSSDLQRAIYTAEIIYSKPVPEENRLFSLRERNFGIVDGQPGKHLLKLRAEQAATYDTLSDEEKWQHKYTPDMESDFELAERFMAALKEIALNNPGRTVLVASHGGTLRTTLLRLGYMTREELPPGSVKNAGYIKLRFANGVFNVVHAENIT